MTIPGTLRAMFEPARFPPPPLDGLALAWRYLIAGGFYVLYLAMILAVGASPDWLSTDTTYVPPPLPVAVLDLTLGAFALVGVHWRRRWPLATYLALEVVTLVSPSTAFTSVWAFLSLCSRRHLLKIGIGVAVSSLLSLVAIWRPWSPPAPGELTLWEAGPIVTVGGWLSGVVFTVVIALIGMYYGTRQDRTAGVQDRIDNAERERELAVLGERNRIAREMHDVLAHRISLVSMHSGALAFREDLTPEQTRSIAQTIQENAHASLTELRSVLSTLRDGQVEPIGTPPAPQPTLAQLPALLNDARRGGQQIAWSSTLELEHVPQVTARHAYRILQECLTNARKHAPLSPVTVQLSGVEGQSVELRVSNAVGTPSRVVPGAGLGLIGIRERVSMLGGSVQLGREGAEFVVHCVLPWGG